MSLNFDVIVLGAGAAGLMCAAQAGQRGRRVLLLDHAVRLAEKIRISGGGRCNFTNVNVRPECYLSDNPHFCRSALAQYTQHDFIKLVEWYGIACHEKTLGQLFCDDSSQSIIDLLLHECELGGVERRMGVTVQAVDKPSRFRVTTDAGVFEADSVVVATGGLSIPQIGATPFGYRLAEQFGLRVTPLAPALVPLTFQPGDVAVFGELAGIAIEVEACAERGPAFREAALLTHKGASGPAMLQVSSYWRPGESLTLDLCPGVDLEARLAEDRHSDKLLGNWLAGFWPRRFAQAFVELFGDNRPLRSLDERSVARLFEAIRGFVLRPNGTQGYRKAEVTRGGIDTRDLSSKTMMAREVPGLFFVGELVDVTGWLGGYNFQWAWSSGWVAGQHC